MKKKYKVVLERKEILTTTIQANSYSDALDLGVEIAKKVSKQLSLDKERKINTSSHRILITPVGGMTVHIVSTPESKENTEEVAPIETIGN